MQNSPKVQEIIDAQKATWNKFAPGWKKWDGLLMRSLQPMSDAVVDAAGLKRGDQVLDLATGTGEPGLTAATRIGDGKVLGLDVAAEMVAIANENAKARGLGNYAARTQEASQLDFPEGAFDAVVCRLGVMFFGDPPATLKELLRLLKPGRKASLSAWGEPAQNPHATLIGGILAKGLGLPPPPEDAPGIFRFSSQEKFRGLLEGAGFRDVAVTEAKGEVSWETPLQYWEYMTEIAAPIAKALAGAPPEKSAEMKAQVLEEAGKRIRDGQVTLAWSAWIASGTK